MRGSVKVNEIFESIQGEGYFVGEPALFIRFSGCTRKCHYCDTNFDSYTKMTVQQLIDTIRKHKMRVIVFTGGEPCLHYRTMKAIIDELITDVFDKLKFFFCVETNGDVMVDYSIFDYVCFSPKDKGAVQKVLHYIDTQKLEHHDVKITTDLSTNKNLINAATMLMPLTKFDEVNDKKTKQKVWNYCVKYRIRYSPRLHTEVWGNLKGK